MESSRSVIQNHVTWQRKCQGRRRGDGCPCPLCPAAWPSGGSAVPAPHPGHTRAGQGRRPHGVSLRRSPSAGNHTS